MAYCASQVSTKESKKLVSQFQDEDIFDDKISKVRNNDR